MTAFIGSTGEFTRWRCRKFHRNGLYRAGANKISKAEVTPFGGDGQVKNVNK